MGVYIKGMEMPKSCRECGCEQGGFWCGLMDEHKDTTCFTDERREDCPIIHFTGHGRLIDADALIKKIAENMNKAKEVDNYDWWNACSVAGDFVMETPTIIPADKEMI